MNTVTKNGTTKLKINSTGANKRTKIFFTDSVTALVFLAWYIFFKII